MTRKEIIEYLRKVVEPTYTYRECYYILEKIERKLMKLV